MHSLLKKSAVRSIKLHSLNLIAAVQYIELHTARNSTAIPRVELPFQEHFRLPPYTLYKINAVYHLELHLFT